MKRFALLIIAIILSLPLFACGEKTSPAEDFEYEMVDGEIVITGYKGTDREIYIPTTINDRPVTVIGREAFTGYDMTSIRIPDTVTEIGYYSFFSCSSLVNVTFPASLEEIDSYAFCGCDSLVSIDLPESVKEINDYAFSGCDSLEDVRLPTELDRIGIGVFQNCDKLDSAKILENVKIY